MGYSRIWKSARGIEMVSYYNIDNDGIAKLTETLPLSQVLTKS